MRNIFCSLVLVVLITAGCQTAAINAVSSVSTADLPATKYKKIIVFAENVQGPEQQACENIAVSTLKSEGVAAESSVALFSQSPGLDSAAEGALIHDQGYDAALYLTVGNKGTSEDPPDPAMHPIYFPQTGQIQYQVGFLVMKFDITATPFSINPQGQIVVVKANLAMTAELQDVNTAKEVWKTDVSSSLDTHGEDLMSNLYQQVIESITKKLRSDHAI